MTNESGFRQRRLKYTVWSLVSIAACAGLAFALWACGSGGSSAPTTLINKGLWVANSGAATVPEFVNVQTAVTGVSTPVPQLTNQSPVFFSPQDTVFDAFDNLWVVEGEGTGTTGVGVFEFTNTQIKSLLSVNKPNPNFSITNSGGLPGFVFPRFGVFDSSRNLYVSDSNLNVIFMFAAQQLPTPTPTPNMGATPTPTPTPSMGLMPAAVFQIANSKAVVGEAFDSAGNLFVADNGSSQIFMVAKGDIPASRGTASSPIVVPATVVLSSNMNATFASIDAPWGLTFDKDGNLWFTNEGTATGASVVSFAASSLITSGTPTPRIQLTPAAISGTLSIVDPQGLSFDNVSDLAVANNAEGMGTTIAIFSSGQLGHSGSPQPDVFFSGVNTTLSGPAGLIFGPNING